MFSNFSDLRREDTASLASYAHQIRKVIETVGADVLAFELEQELLIRKTKAGRDASGEMLALKGESELENDNIEDENKVEDSATHVVAITRANDARGSTSGDAADWSVLQDKKSHHDLQSIFTKSHLELLQTMVDIQSDRAEIQAKLLSRGHPEIEKENNGNDCSEKESSYGTSSGEPLPRSEGASEFCTDHLASPTAGSGPATELAALSNKQGEYVQIHAAVVCLL